MLFSVIVPTHNRLHLLKRTIESLLKQTFKDFEIIVVDDGSTDGTAKYLADLEKNGHVIPILQTNKGPAVARNVGIRRAAGKYIAFTDDDCVVPSDWLDKLHSDLNIGKIAGVGGSARTGDTSNLYAVANDMIVNFLKSELNELYQFNPPFLTSNNTAYSKLSLESVGGFDEGYFIGAEERDLNYLLFLKGERLTYDPAIIVEHHNDSNFKKFLIHQFDQGKGSRRFYTNILREHGRKPEMIPRGVYRKIFSHPFKVEPFGRAIRLFFLFGFAQMAITAGYVYAALTGRKSHAGNPSMHDSRK